MPVSYLTSESLRHAVFLQRITSSSSATSLDARLGEGAFLALRLVDLLDPEREPISPEAFHYQHVATDRFCRELRATGTEGAHVHGVAESAAVAYRLGDVRLLAPHMLAYAHYLEDLLQLEEALDVLATLIRVGGVRLTAPDAIAARLRIARVNRKLNRFDEAEEAYAEAGQLAAASGDVYSQLLSRIGHASVLWGGGDLAEAEQTYRSILAQGQRAGYRDIEARAEHGLGVALYARGQPDEAVRHVWRAFELYEDEASQLRALNDIGGQLLAVGEVNGAERALTEVVRRGGGQDNVSNALVELMHCASYRRDQVAFERRRQECEARADLMPPNILTDFYLKAGIGEARFGHFRKARTLMKQALETASRGGLHEFEFRIERIMAGLRDCEASLRAGEPAAAEPTIQSEALREVSTALAGLGA